MDQQSFAAYVSGCSVAKPVVRKHHSVSEVRPVHNGALDGEVPIREGDGGVDGLQGLLEHQRDADVSRDEARSVVPVIAVRSASCKDTANQDKMASFSMVKCCLDIGMGRILTSKRPRTLG